MVGFDPLIVVRAQCIGETSRGGPGRMIALRAFGHRCFPSIPTADGPMHWLEVHERIIVGSFDQTVAAAELLCGAVQHYPDVPLFTFSGTIQRLRAELLELAAASEIVSL